VAKEEVILTYSHLLFSLTLGQSLLNHFKRLKKEQYM